MANSNIESNYTLITREACARGYLCIRLSEILLKNIQNFTPLLLRLQL
jgi:hypothetical protein